LREKKNSSPPPREEKIKHIFLALQKNKGPSSAATERRWSEQK